MDTALPFKGWAPAEATHAAPSSAIEAAWVGFTETPLIISTMDEATTRPIMAEGIPVLGGAGVIGGVKMPRRPNPR